ncbi:MAG: hypothetical protein PHN82_00140 [bacterium]|nr:hypothetical protein [bacterium]
MSTMMARCAVLCAAFSAAIPAGAGQRGRYPFRSAVVTYRITGSIQEGSETVTIDEHGLKRRVERETTMDLPGGKRRDSTLQIDDGENVYTIDLIRRRGTRAPSYARRAREMVEAMDPGQREAMEEIGRDLARGLGGIDEIRMEGAGTVLGRECAIYEVMGVRTWKWNGLPLRTENPALGNMVQEAVEISVDVPVPPDRFRPPPGIEFTDPRPGAEG